MSYFNEDQQDYMRSLSAIPPEQKCWCGWYPVGECHTCPKDKTNADRIKEQTPPENEPQ